MPPLDSTSMIKNYMERSYESQNKISKKYTVQEWYKVYGILISGHTLLIVKSSFKNQSKNKCKLVANLTLDFFEGGCNSIMACR